VAHGKHHGGCCKTRRGFSIVESAVSIVIVAVMVVAALNTLAGAVQARQVRMQQGRARTLALDLLGEVVANYYEEPATIVDQTMVLADASTIDIPQTDPDATPVFGPEPGEADGTRRNFDDVDDYHAWTSSPPETKDGTPLDGYVGWSRSVRVWYANLATLTPTVPNTGLKLIQVTVMSPDEAITSVMALRANGGAFDQPPSVYSTYVTWVGMELKAVGGVSPVHAGLTSLNQAP